MNALKCCMAFSTRRGAVHLIFMACPVRAFHKGLYRPALIPFWRGAVFPHGAQDRRGIILEILAPELNDRILADMLDLETGVIVKLHIHSIDQTEAIKDRQAQNHRP